MDGPGTTQILEEAHRLARRNDSAVVVPEIKSKGLLPEIGLQNLLVKATLVLFA